MCCCVSQTLVSKSLIFEFSSRDKMEAKLEADVEQVSPEVEEVVCTGGEGALGHPKIYLSFDGQAQVQCYYCGKIFTKK